MNLTKSGRPPRVEEKRFEGLHFTICPNLSDFHDRKVIPSGEKPVCPDEIALNDVSSGERVVVPDETNNRESASEPHHRARRSAC